MTPATTVRPTPGTNAAAVPADVCDQRRRRERVFHRRLPPTERVFPVAAADRDVRT
ncbi:hypothetical protein [Streptomyces sp. NPDC001401]|uniref:hypothetical protein n=1 Tax=Streptomyces sp. NPDC001401 TaxID=3364570 RepID=UPI0036CE5C30